MQSVVRDSDAGLSVKSAALFDVDKTLVSVNTARLYVKWRVGRKELTFVDYLRMSRVLLSYAFGTLDPEAAAQKAFRVIEGYSEAKMRDECLTWYQKVVRPHITDLGRSEIARCRADGMVCALLSASTAYLTEPLANDLNIDHVICTRLSVQDGKFTGRWEPPLCYGAGKLERAQAWARSEGVDLQRSSFYTDSISDLPVLEAVGSPRVINPDPRLRLLALRRGYPMEQWK